MNTRKRPFDIAKDLINSCGLDISYYYDDLIFSSHSLLLLQFDNDNPEVLQLYFNKDCEADKEKSIKELLGKESKSRGIIIVDKGKFHLTENTETQEITP